MVSMKPGDHPEFFRFPAPEGRSRESTILLDREGRFWHDGELVETLDPDDLERLRERLRSLADDEVVVAVCCLFAYLNPAQEDAVAAIVREALPGVPISVSHEVSPVWREYERATDVYGSRLTVVRLRSPRDARKWLEAVSSAPDAAG